ncbi:hypothetical protein ANO14919_105790 [Xylariales sp. No.14919]|nr:hypothetical protein ANO14919_105790 [Xylariales sp. No.14919]
MKRQASASLATNSNSKSGNARNEFWAPASCSDCGYLLRRRR